MDKIHRLIMAHQGSENWTAQAEIFDSLFTVFLTLGTIVGIIVVTYTLYNAYKYRDGSGNGVDEGDGYEPPVIGELPSGKGEKGRKLFVSFGLSAILVIGLVTYSYALLLDVERGPTEDIEGDEELEVEVTGYQFGWQFNYPNGHEQHGELRVPEDTVVKLRVTSDDVWHNFGVTELRIKSDSIPGQYSETWFIAEEGTYDIECFELCGAGHSRMVGEVNVVPQEEFDEWYADAGDGDQRTFEHPPGEGDEEDGHDEENGHDEEDAHDAADATAAPSIAVAGGAP